MLDRVIVTALFLIPILALLAWRLLIRDRGRGRWLIPSQAVFLTLALAIVAAWFFSSTRNVPGWWIVPEVVLLGILFARRKGRPGEPDTPPRWRWTVGRMMILVAILALFVMALADWLNRDPTEYGRLIRATDASLNALATGASNDTDVDAWLHCSALIHRAYFEAGFDNTSGSLREMSDFEDDLSRWLNGPVRPATLQWVWNRMGKIERLKAPMKKYEKEFSRYYDRFTASLGKSEERRAVIPR